MLQSEFPLQNAVAGRKTPWAAGRASLNGASPSSRQPYVCGMDKTHLGPSD